MCVLCVSLCVFMCVVCVWLSMCVYVCVFSAWVLVVSSCADIVLYIPPPPPPWFTNNVNSSSSVHFFSICVCCPRSLSCVCANFGATWSAERGTAPLSLSLSPPPLPLPVSLSISLFILTRCYPLQGKVLLIASLHSADDHYEHSLNTLKFAQVCIS